MKVLIVGSGGREHGIAWSVSKSPKVDKIYCAPGNAGIAELAECVDIGAMEFEKLADFAQEKAIDLTIIGMDDPLVGGVVDVFEARGLKVFGPRKNAAILEGSKAFSKDLMKKYNIPTAAYENFDDPEKALEYLRTEARFPIVLKADGLALGKGVLICQDLKEAEDGVKEIMEDKKFGNAGNTMVIEEFMTGREVSVLSFVDGKTIRTMTSAQDHKRAQILALLDKFLFRCFTDRTDFRCFCSFINISTYAAYKFFHSLSFLSFCCVFNFIISNFVVYNSFLFLILVTVTDITLA